MGLLMNRSLTTVLSHLKPSGLLNGQHYGFLEAYFFAANILASIVTSTMISSLKNFILLKV